MDKLKNLLAGAIVTLTIGGCVGGAIWKIVSDVRSDGWIMLLAWALAGIVILAVVLVLGWALDRLGID